MERFSIHPSYSKSDACPERNRRALSIKLRVRGLTNYSVGVELVNFKAHCLLNRNFFRVGFLRSLILEPNLVLSVSDIRDH